MLARVEHIHKCSAKGIPTELCTGSYSNFVLLFVFLLMEVYHATYKFLALPEAHISMDGFFKLRR